MIHFLGIKGAGVSALAIIMKNLGYDVQGSNSKGFSFTERDLKANNIQILEEKAENIQENMTIIRSVAVKDDHVEIVKAKELGLTIYSYPEYVGLFTKDFKLISITGCHGKTTTTALLAHLLKNTIGCNYLIGDGSGEANSKSEYFVLEACEYHRHFLNYYPYYTVITNIELDHVDYFKDIDDVVDAYQSLVNQTKNKVIACGDDDNVRKIKSDNIIYYGFNSNNDIEARNIIYSTNGTKFDVYINNNFYANFQLPYFGEHLILNALAVITIGYLENLEINDIINELKTFPGAKRRFSEEIIEDTIIIDDYAHHPTEIKVTIKAAKQKYPNKKIIAIYQPHTYSRTSKFTKEYADVLNLADEVYLLPIHPAREKQEEYPGISSEVIIKELGKGHLIECSDGNALTTHKGDVLLFMGANDLAEIIDGTKKMIIN